MSRRVYAPCRNCYEWSGVIRHASLVSLAAGSALLLAGCLHDGEESVTPPPAAITAADCEAEEVAEAGQIPPGCSPEAVYRIKAGAICLRPGAGVPVRRSMLLPRFDVMVEQLHALEPPPSLRKPVRGWLAALDEALRHLKRARAARAAARPQVERAELQLFTNLNIRAQFRAEGLDIEGCAETE